MAKTHGVTTLANALELGVTPSQVRTLVRNGHLVRPHRGLLVATAVPRSWLQDCSLAVHWSRGVLSHRAAARLHELDGFTRDGPEVTIPCGLAIPSFTWPVHRTDRLSKLDVTTVRGIPVTSIARTLVDLGAVSDPESVEGAVDSALRLGVRLSWIWQTLTRLDRPGPTGTAVLRQILEQPDRAGPLPDSMFERLLERLCVAAALPQPIRQYEVMDNSGQLVARLDAAWPEIKLGLEAHSQRWHSGPKSVRRDQERDNRLAALGRELMYATWSHVKDPRDFTEQVQMAYRHRVKLLS